MKRQIFCIICTIFLIGGFLVAAAFLAQRIEYNSHYENEVCVSLGNFINGSYVGWVLWSVVESRVNGTEFVMQNTDQSLVRQHLDEFYSLGELFPCYLSDDGQDIELQLSYMPWMGFILAGILLLGLGLVWLNHRWKQIEKTRASEVVGDFDVL